MHQKWNAGSPLRGTNDTFCRASHNLNPFLDRTVQRISRLCPTLKRLKILANDVSFRQLEQLTDIEEVILLRSPCPLSIMFLLIVGGSPHLDAAHSRSGALRHLARLEGEPHLSGADPPGQLLLAVHRQHWYNNFIIEEKYDKLSF